MFTAGYIPHGKDYIRPDDTGRFHLKKDIDNKTWDLHYDLNVEWRHLSIPFPQRCGREIKRLKIIKWKLFGQKQYIKNPDRIPAKDFEKYVIKRVEPL